MKSYKINDIFYSLQGEGHNAGRAAVFVRFSGCNLKCPFCDTDFLKYEELTAEEIVGRMWRLAAANVAPRSGMRHPGSVFYAPAPMVVLTGGEPTLQADGELINMIHDKGFRFVAMESNGTKQPPEGLSWLTVSPKQGAKVVVSHCDELKVLFDGERPLLPFGDVRVEAEYYYLQPIDTGNARRNKEITAACVDYIKRHPAWRLSLQTHKLIGIK